MPELLWTKYRLVKNIRFLKKTSLREGRELLVGTQQILLQI